MTTSLEAPAPRIEESNETLQKVATILIVDDEDLILKALDKTLSSPHRKILLASNGDQAVKLLHRHEVAVIICDQKMPDISGIEVLKEAIKIQKDAIRIILTGHADLDVVVDAINVGQAAQFILKPWDERALTQTVSACVDKYQLIQENRRLQDLTTKQHRELVRTHDHLTRELRLGARIHEVMLLGHPPNDVPGVELNATTSPSQEIDGDFIDFYRPLPDLFDVVLGDVMGKGIAAALVGTAVKNQLTRFAVPFNRLKVFDEHGVWRDDVFSPQEVIHKVHQELTPSLINLEYFVCLFYGRFDLPRATFSYVDCGSAKPLHYRASEKRVAELEGDNFPLGVTEEDTFRGQEISYGVDDIFVFYSDGVTEARSPAGELYGVDRLKDVVKNHTHQTATELLATIRNSVVDFVESSQFEDDITIITMRIRDTQCPEFAKQAAAKFSSELSQAKAVRDFVHRLCMHAPGDKERLSELLQLAIDEAFSNVVIHGYPTTRGHIVIKGELTKDGVLVELSDQGRVFDPSDVPDPSFAGDKPSGFGWYLIREIADKVIYAKKEAEQGWNHLKIYKQYITDEGNMDISHDTKEGVLVVTLEGEHLDAKETPFFKQKILDLLNNESTAQAVFDLHRLQFIDSSGLGAFLSILKILHGKGGDLKLAGMSRTIRTMFELVCMHKIFEIFNSPEEALRSFK